MDITENKMQSEMVNFF